MSIQDRPCMRWISACLQDVDLDIPAKATCHARYGARRVFLSLYVAFNFGILYNFFPADECLLGSIRAGK